MTGLRTVVARAGSRRRYSERHDRGTEGRERGPGGRRHLRATVALLVVAVTGPSMPTPAVPPPASATSLTDAVVQRINRLRVTAGCRAWRPAAPLQRAAQSYAFALSGSGVLSHVDSLGGTAEDRVRREGYRGSVIEVLASAVIDPDTVAAGLGLWADRTDLLDCRYRSFGAALDRGYLVVLVGDR